MKDFKEELEEVAKMFEGAKYRKLRNRPAIITTYLDLDRYKKIYKRCSRELFERQASSQYACELTLMIMSKHYYGPLSKCAVVRMPYPNSYKDACDKFNTPVKLFPGMPMS